MANIKSAKKRILVAATRTERNKAIRSQIKTVVKKVEAAVAASDKAAAEEAMKLSAKLLDTAAGKGVIHHNSADRKKSRMNLKFNKLA